MPMAGKGMGGKSLAALVGFSILPSLGILMYRVTAWTIYRSDFAYVATDVHIFSLLAQFTFIALLIVLERKIDYTLVTLQRLTVVATIVMMIGGLLVVSSIFLVNSNVLIVLGCVIHGAASAVLFLGWGAFTCSIEPRKSALYVALAFVLYSIMAFLMQETTSEFLYAAIVLSPLFCGVLLLYCFRTTADLQEVEVLPNKTVLRRLPWGMFGLLFACCLVSVITEIMLPMQGSMGLYSFNHFWFPVFLFIFVVFVIWVFILKHDNPDQLWSLFAFVIFGGLLGFSSFSFIDLDISVWFMRATQDCYFMFSWLLMAGLVYREKLPKVMCFGLGTIVFIHMSSFPVTFFEWLFPATNVESNSPVAVGLAFIMAIILIVFTLILMSRRSSMSEEENSQKVSSSGEFEDSVNWLSAEYGLSSREKEVTELLLRGYTLPQIGKELYIAHDTVRSHAKSIYRKLGIHHKQELIKMVEQRNQRPMSSPMD